VSETIGHKSAKHYCASNRRASGRVHLPIAPKARARIRFSPEKPLPRALTPEQALNWIDYLHDQGENIKVANLSGPGDPLATPELTIQTLHLMRERYPDISLCLTTLGCGAAKLAYPLAKYGLAHVSILMDAVEPEIAQKIYAWIRPGTRNLALAEAASLLMEEQSASIAALVEKKIPVQVKTTVYAGINSGHVTEIASKAAALGVSEMKVFPFLASGEDCPRPAEEADPTELAYLARQASQYLPAVFIDLAACQDMEELEFNEAAFAAAGLPKPSEKRPYLAVCSSNGFDVDLHLGQADRFLIFGPQDGPVVLLATRPAPEPGGGDARWQETSLILSDCFAVLAAAAGEAPQRILGEKSLSVLTREGNLEGLVDLLYGGKKKGGKK